MLKSKAESDGLFASSTPIELTVKCVSFLRTSTSRVFGGYQLGTSSAVPFTASKTMVPSRAGQRIYFQPGVARS
jgi:hypothetical protein